jgi:5-methylcytosine-specific restriction endonuclease McrA
MPTRPARICSCGKRVESGARCACQAASARQRDRLRPSARQRGYDSNWERESKLFLARPENRYCSCGCGRRADVVDHHVAHKGNRDLFWDWSNWRPMAFECNSRKAAKQEGGFGHPRRA